MRLSTNPLAVALHIAALEGAVERVSVELLQEGTATAEEHVLRAPALVAQLHQNLSPANQRGALALRESRDWRVGQHKCSPLHRMRHYSSTADELLS